MPPLILHNVPEEELYVGEDGIQRPYAMVFPSSDGTTGLRARKNMVETGSFGKSRRRSRSKSSGVPTKKEALSQQAADEVFSNLLSNQAKTRAQSPIRKQSTSTALSQSQLGSVSTNNDGKSGDVTRYVHREPTEIILRGFGINQNYAAIKHYETLAGRICEDYPRDPPPEQRRYKADLRDQAALRSIPLTANEKEKARRYAGGDHWIKITFESAEAAESALYTSPQAILGYLVYAESYNGSPPTNTESIPAPKQRAIFDTEQNPALSLFTARVIDPKNMAVVGRDKLALHNYQASQQLHPEQNDASSPNSHTSSSTTLDTATTSESSITVVPDTQSDTAQHSDSASPEFCRRIPTAKRATLLPASQALLPQQTLTQRISSHIPLLSWLGRDVIGNQVPRTENGEFDWAIASFYWRLCWLLDFYFRLMNGELVGNVDC